jgi:hypothetical protein
LNSVYHVAFMVGAIFAVAAAVIGGVLLRPLEQHTHSGPEPPAQPAVPDAD